MLGHFHSGQSDVEVLSDADPMPTRDHRPRPPASWAGCGRGRALCAPAMSRARLSIKMISGRSVDAMHAITSHMDSRTAASQIGSPCSTAADPWLKQRHL